jgi:copper chaperone CopZ
MKEKTMLNRLPVMLGLTLAWCGCCASLPVGELHAQTPTKASRCYLLEIKGMTCEGCAAHVQKALVHVPGVAEAKVTYAKSEAQVCIKPGQTVSGDPLVKAVEKAGYKAKVKWQSQD